MDLLLIHGVLHLLGYDHETSPLRADAMQTREEKVLEALKRGPDRGEAARERNDAPNSLEKRES
jgi:ssRNA-specific RNase YbeY (16S rRNA maturation enzyme)